MKKASFLEIAAQEYLDAQAYYKQQNIVISKAFVKEFKLALKRITRNPLAWSIRESNIHTYTILRFPYKIFYIIEKTEIIIIAVAHHHRKPDYWINRKI